MAAMLTIFLVCRACDLIVAGSAPRWGSWQAWLGVRYRPKKATPDGLLQVPVRFAAASIGLFLAGLRLRSATDLIIVLVGHADGPKDDYAFAWRSTRHDKFSKRVWCSSNL